MTKLFVFISVLFIYMFAIISTVDVTICHHTGSETNPYTLNTVSVHSVDDANGLNGHGMHPEDAWLPFVFDGVKYDGQNDDLFGKLIDNNCNLIIPPTSTPLPTNTPLPTPTNTPTSTPTSTSTNEPFPTPTEVPSATPTDTATPIASNTPTNTPIATKTNDPTNTPTNTPTLPPYNTETPTQTPTRTLAPTDTPTMTPTSSPTPTGVEPTATPRPPVPAEANMPNEYDSKLLGTIYMDGKSYELYQGINAPDGTLALPTTRRGAALFNNTIWVHRVWNSGWLNLKVGDTVMIFRDGKFSNYKIVISEHIPYGYYPTDSNLHIATCMSTNGMNWTNVELFTLQPVDKAK